MRLFTQVFICTLALTVAVNQKDGDEGKPYEFGFTIDGQQHRHEKKDENGIIQGEFGFITADGVYHVTVYATDENGSFKILSMKNIRISAPLDGSPATGPISPEASKYLGKAGLPAAPQPVQKFERLQQQPAITESPKKFYNFTTQPTIKPACAGCGYVTTSKPFQLQYQNPAYQKPSVPTVQNGFAAQPPQSQQSFQNRFDDNGGQQPAYQQNGFASSPVQPQGPSPVQQLSQSNFIGQQPPSFPSQQPSSFPPQQPQSFPSQQPQSIPSQQPQSFPSQQPQRIPSQQPQSFPSQQPQSFPSQELQDFQQQQPQNQPSFPGSFPPGPNQNVFTPQGPPSVQSIGSLQGPSSLPGQPQGVTGSQNFIQTPPDVELLPPGTSTGTLAGNLQVQQKQQQQPGAGPFGVQQNEYSRPTGIQTHGSLIQQIPQTQNRYDPVDISQGPTALNSPPFVNTGNLPNQQEQKSTLPPITVSDKVIHVGGKNPQDIPIQDKFPGMEDGLPDGVEDTDVKNILYKFKYIVGFHGHYEKGLRNGAKIGGYFVNGRDGFSRVVTYVADEYGYRPKFKLINLGLDSPDTPKEDTEKTFGLKSFEFVWYPIE